MIISTNGTKIKEMKIL